ncbi:uncharacterized protein HaLaN_09957 [Haematococcus lacustris]|uniref:Uncharacterized protein n=1 Tax=Haematococcus lacustris TaxID=44745 RepID=A0A699Z3Y0_HAELA|nr:uncharacterized protein HaLaN_09957 [Haematococcus lacustris]
MGSRAAGPSGSSAAAGPSGSSVAAGPSGCSAAAGPPGCSSSNKRQSADIGSGLAEKRALHKLTRSQVQHDSGLIQAHRNTPRWDDNVKLELQHLAAATPAGTSMVAIQRHVAVTLATWDAVWGEYLHPKLAEEKDKALEEEAANVSQRQWGTRKQLVVFFGNACSGTRAL